MTEKVIFELRVRDEKGGIKYEVRQGEKTYTCSRRMTHQCLPLAFSQHRKSLSRMHRRFIQCSQKRVRETLNALESMYADFYGNENATRNAPTTSKYNRGTYHRFTKMLSDIFKLLAEQKRSYIHSKEALTEGISFVDTNHVCQIVTTCKK